MQLYNNPYLICLVKWNWIQNGKSNEIQSQVNTLSHTHTLSMLSAPSVCLGIPGSLQCVHVEGSGVIDPDWASQEEIPACHWPTLLHVSTLLSDHQRQPSPPACRPACLLAWDFWLSDGRGRREKWTYNRFRKITSRSCLSSRHWRFSGLVTVKTSPRAFLPSLLLLRNPVAHRLFSSSK